MIRRPMLLTAIATTLALGACGGGNDDTDPTPTPTPTGTASPTPTPTASPTYTAFPLTANTEYFTLSASTSYTGDLATGPVTLGAAGTEGRSDRVRIALSSDFATGTYVFREASGESRFTDDNIVTGMAPDAANREYVFRTTVATGTAGNFAQAEFLNNTIKDKVTSDTGLQLLRSSYGAWWRGESTAGLKRITYTSFGYATASSDMPSTGTATYNTRIVGRVVRVNTGGTGTLTRVGGTATITVNFATGLVNTTLNVTTVAADGTQTAYGTFRGQGAIAVGANQFNGSFDGSTSPIPGTFAGSFYGSQGAEIGITFAGLGTISTVDTRLVGVVVGKKS